MELIKVFCEDAEELYLTQRTDSSHINYSDGYIKTSSFVFAECARVIVCFYVVLEGRSSKHLPLKPISV